MPADFCLDELREGVSQGYWLCDDDFVSTAGRSAFRLGALGFPRDWPAAYARSKALRLLLGKRGHCPGKQARVVGLPSDQECHSLQESALRPLQSFFNAELVERALGHCVVHGWAVYEHLDLPLSAAFVAERFWWNQAPTGQWLDFTPRPWGWPRVLLVEAAGARPPPHWTTLTPLEAGLTRLLMAQRFVGVPSSGEGTGRGSSPSTLPSTTKRHSPQALVCSWAEKLARTARGCGSDDAAFFHCKAMLADFGCELRQADMNERYFRSYALSAQQGMLSDAPRTEAFRRALMQVCAGGGVVLDVGCGSAVLSMFAAKGGADHVIAVEANRISVRIARTLVEANGLSGKVTVLEGCVEDLAEAIDRELARHGGKLRVLVSEFVGFCIVYEGMFASVAFARDRWRPVEVVPRSGDVFVCPFFAEGYPQRAVDFWMQEHYGLDFSPAAKAALRSCTDNVLIDQLHTDNMLCESKHVWHLDCTQASAEEASKMDPLQLNFEVTTRGPLHGLCVFFELELAPGVMLPCGPTAPRTHWMQMMALFHAKEDAVPFPMLWPHDSISVTFGFSLVRGRFLEIRASGNARTRGGSRPPWIFNQTWHVTPDPVLEPAREDL
mmetsp:Transcript_73821/g.171221  ORF Transcript_73821/g.171221 Transcript_73821/m.171221 type:complete len:610 (+) Transcript_73821:61-1890(+)|eukprot:CAMPEP_0171062252 /NCGR_PEP_ID=MMETSP0766_2-20121228/4963_1 /TAXON_ID=439317 /ORGANISM="Gambierdiscus australes, Strain CAWD 149" /LENGTH=609 /DNA_ID=CAMNT_0011518045 /DNA_START=15 /DNA_END=1844 /DNA_ORIENTATION=-